MLTSRIPQLLGYDHWHLPPGHLANFVHKAFRAEAAMRNSLAAQYATAALGGACGWTRPRNFLVLGSVRSGTTLMVDYLNCHPRIRCRGEILGENGDRYGDPWRMTRQRLRLHVEALFVKRPRVLAGAKILTYHVDRLPLKLRDMVELLDRPRMIVLYRQRLLDQFVSLRIAESDGLWHVKKPTKPAAISLDPDDFLAYAAEERRMRRESLSGLGDCDVHYLSYERLTAAAEIEMRDVFAFLGVTPCTVQSKLLKRNPDDLSRKLKNHLQFLAPAVQAQAYLRLPLADKPAELLRAAA